MASIRRVQRIHKTKSINLPADMCRVLDIRIGDSIVFLLDRDGWVKFRKIDLEKRPDLAMYVEADLPILKHD